MLRWLSLVMLVMTATAATRVGDAGIGAVRVGDSSIAVGHVGSSVVYTPPAPPLSAYETVWLKLDDTGATKELVNSGTAAVTFTNVVSNASALAVEGKLGGAFAYTSSERSVCADAALMQLLAGTSYSFAFWAKRASTSVHAAWFCMQFAPPDDVSMSYYNKDNSTLFWYYFVTGNLPGVYKQFSMPANAWQHFAYTRRGSVFRLYVNGALVTTVMGSPVYTPLHMTWGWAWDGTSLTGNTRTMDDIRVYDFALSAAEVASLYNGGNGSESTLVPAPDTYVTVTFDAASGAVSPESAEVAVGVAYGTLPVPTRAGFVFAGWYDAGLSLVTADTVVTATEDYFLTASWEAAQITVYFNAGDGWADYTEALYTPGVAYGALPVAWNNDPTYLFSYWEIDMQPVDIDTVVPETEGPLYAYAIYTQPMNTYTVYLDPNGGTVDPSSFSGISEATTYESLGLPAPYLDGFNFDGWFSAAYGQYVGGGNYLSINSDDTLTAQWSAQ